MNAFQSVFSIALKHDYFADGVWRHCFFSPTASTQKILDSANMLCKPSAHGLTVYVDEGKKTVLGLYAESGWVSLVFKVVVQDKNYANYTACSKSVGQTVGYFSNQRRLTEQTWVDEQDFMALDELIALGILTAQDKRTAPDFVLHVQFKPDEMGLAFVLNFQARESWWKYYLLGDIARKNTVIVDLDNRFEFACCGEVALQNGLPAKLFKSLQRIPVQEKSSYRFQLKEAEQRATRVLIKRLGVASEGRLGLELIDGKRELVFENFVNF